MYPVPITYLFDFEFSTEKMRPYIMAEFAANGARHLVLTDVLISQCMQNPRLKNQLKDEIAQAGLTFLDAHAPFGTNEDLNVPDPSLRGAMLDRQPAHTEAANQKLAPHRYGLPYLHPNPR